MMRRNIFLVLSMIVIMVFISQTYSQTAQQLFSEAIKNAQSGNHEKAIEYFEQVIDMHPNFAPAYNYLGLSYQEIGLDLTEIAWYFRTAVEIDPNYEEALINLGKTYYGLGHFDLSEKQFRSVLSANPKSVDAHLSLGWVYLLGKSNPERAILSFRSALEMIQHPSAYFGLGMAYFMNAETPRALECITALRALQHDNLAQQLELIIRDSEYVSQEQRGQPLLETSPVQSPFLMPREPRVSVSMPAETRITVTGTMPVRLTGRFDFDSQEPSDNGNLHKKDQKTTSTHIPTRVLISEDQK